MLRESQACHPDDLYHSKSEMWVGLAEEGELVNQVDHADRVTDINIAVAVAVYLLLTGDSGTLTENWINQHSNISDVELSGVVSVVLDIRAENGTTSVDRIKSDAPTATVAEVIGVM